MIPVAIFYHCSFYKDAQNAWPMAIPIVWEQWQLMRSSGLVDAASHILCGVNGGDESLAAAGACFQGRAALVMHGVNSKAENLTIVELQRWVKDHPGYAVLYFHSKGISHAPGSDYGERVAGPWRRCMTKYLVENWKQCVADLEQGNDIACVHWMWNMGSDQSQHIPAGNFLWMTSDFAAKLPSIYERERIKISGISSLESRYESEVFWGNGPRPNVKQYLPNGGEGCP